MVRQAAGGPYYDCSSLVIDCCKRAGLPLTCTFTGNMNVDLLKHGFEDVTGSVDPSTGAGLGRGEIVAVLVAALCDIAISVIINGAGIDIDITFGTLITPVVLLWYIITELGSIIENAGKLGATIPEWLKKWLRNYKDKIDSDHEPPAEIIEADET